MPIRSRLLSFLIILAVLSTSSYSVAVGDPNSINAKSATEAYGKSAATEFPFGFVNPLT